MAGAHATKTSWRLQEFVAHSSNVSCLALGKSSGRLLATGGEDCKVNIWGVNKSNCIMSLTGHNNPVECIQFNSSEEQVAAGSQSGSLRVWDLEAAKILRSLSGHKANITSLDFHPFGDYLASGSMDTNIKVWDVRRKGCVFTYKSHSQAVRYLAFSPDGKWLASAGDDSTIKLWDVTAGKIITEFTAHTAAVNIIQFHPNEYLLASGSSDRTIKLWDLEKFKMIGSSDVETGAVRCVLFHPDGGCLYSGASDSLRVYGWEPDRCFDVVPVGWGKVADMAICNNKLIGLSHHQTNVSSYLVDLTRVKRSGGAVVQPTEPSPKGSTLRRSYERPMTTCSGPQRVKQSSESERRSPSSEDEKEENESAAEIRNADDYHEIFQPRNAISRSPPKPGDLFPAPMEDETFIVRASSVKEAMTPMPDKQQNSFHKGPEVLGDEEAQSQIKKGHDTMCVMLSSRQKNLEAVKAVWGSGDVKNCLDMAVAMNDRSIVVDLLNIVNLKPVLWKLDLCTSILPQIEELLQSKYESYVQTGCMSLKLILKRFWPLISETLKAPPSVGVDITREERLQKCKACFKQLKNLSNVVKTKADQVGRHGSAFKELQLLLAPLDY
ncbi:katanin p80 WD40 repeat-containing subunit B1 isoform X2 [Gadus macrocephalus]|uniref:katanin p80 WD40 repeat-containing subunit B1 isoform X2 n=1 Tax=Gadus macrocephalus TaxID=80720 RepID=UPI0028CBB287|nr:katanin p80 WD40 repeat-containing subunit B1 isoform X2 [Gadus macrocephalus]